MTIKAQEPPPLEDVFAADALNDAANQIIAHWCEALHEAYHLAKGERLNELQGRYVSRYDSQGLQPLSAACGRVYAFRALYPPLSALDFNPHALKDCAREDAEIGFFTDFLNKHRLGEVLMGSEAA